MRVRGDWRSYPDDRHVGQTVVEREAPTEPLLYAPDGRPLVEAKRPVGFQMKTTKRSR